MSFLTSLFLLLLTQNLCAQTTVSGRVTDDKGQVLPGVSVSVKGEAGGATTNERGRYSLKLSTQADSLVFSYVGFTTQTVALDVSLSKNCH